MHYSSDDFTFASGCLAALRRGEGCVTGCMGTDRHGRQGRTAAQLVVTCIVTEASTETHLHCLLTLTMMCRGSGFSPGSS